MFSELTQDCLRSTQPSHYEEQLCATTTTGIGLLDPSQRTRIASWAEGYRNGRSASNPQWTLRSRRVVFVSVALERKYIRCRCLSPLP